MSLRGPSRLMVLAALVVTATATLHAQRFTSRAVAVRVDVLVTNGGQLVRGLSARDFDVRDEGVPQTVSEVELEQIPLNLILVFDTSGSVVGDRMRALLEAGKALLDGLRDQDRVALVSFSTRVRLLTPLTSNRQQIRDAFDTLEAHDATSLRDAAFAGLALRESDPGRTLLLIFSDGDDTSSWLTTPKVIETAKRTDAVVYAVVVPFQRAFWTPQGGAALPGGSSFFARSHFRSESVSWRWPYGTGSPLCCSSRDFCPVLAIHRVGSRRRVAAWLSFPPS